MNAATSYFGGSPNHMGLVDRAIRFKRETVLECLKAMEGRLP
jgi:hypothetical protein